MRISLHWIVLSVAASALSGCLSQTDREAIAFPAMPGQARYLAADGRPLSSEATIEALQTAEATCRNQSGNGAAPSIVGTPAFDACMQSQGYRRVQ
jgi:isoaspartyl peptidase/L-asparaginase-like protein (Ntn-hydrolase superfamily)